MGRVDIKMTHSSGDLCQHCRNLENKYSFLAALGSGDNGYVRHSFYENWAYFLRSKNNAPECIIAESIPEKTRNYAEEIGIIFKYR